jgi:hypothetical protein
MEKTELLKLTLPKLRDLAKESIEGIAGVHGMEKEQLLVILYEHFGIAPDEKVKKKVDPELKKKIKSLSAERHEMSKAGDKKKAEILRKKVHRMKRVTRTA